MNLSDLFPPGATLSQIRKLERNQEYADRLMHCLDFDIEKVKYPCLVSCKFDGLFFQWHHEEGLYSKDGVRYPDWLVEHFKFKEVIYPYPICGEFYGDRLTLQEITKACGINRKTPGPNIEKVNWIVHDIIQHGVSFATRLEAFRKYGHIAQQSVARSKEQLNVIHAHYVYVETEGSVIHDPNALYIRGRSSAVMKRPEWKTGEYRVINIKDGEGKADGIAAKIVILWNDKLVTIGTFRIDYQDRAHMFADWICNPHKEIRVKIQWKNISVEGIPQNASIIQILD